MYQSEEGGKQPLPILNPPQSQLPAHQAAASFRSLRPALSVGAWGWVSSMRVCAVWWYKEGSKPAKVPVASYASLVAVLLASRCLCCFSPLPMTPMRLPGSTNPIHTL